MFFKHAFLERGLKEDPAARVEETVFAEVFAEMKVKVIGKTTACAAVPEAIVLDDRSIVFGAICVKRLTT